MRKPEALLIVAAVQIFSHHPFRTAHDALKRTRMASIQADKVYLKDLYLAVKERGSGVGARWIGFQTSSEKSLEQRRVVFS